MNNFDLLVIGVNTALDTCYQAGQIQFDAVNRVEHVLSAPGGKAINFARAFQRLGGCPLITGIAGGTTGAEIENGLRMSGLAGDFVQSGVESRRTVTVASDAGTTVFLEAGGRIEEAAFNDLVSKVKSLASRFSTIVITGSLPPTAPVDYLATLVGTARSASKASLALDVAGEPLRIAARAGVDMIKINAQEFATTFSVDPTDLTRIGNVYTDLRRSGLSTLCITDGARGALIVAKDDQFAVNTPVKRVVATAGAGDAFLAGLLISLRSGSSLRESARVASAAGSAATQVIGAGFIDPTLVQSLLRVSVCMPAESFFTRAQA